MVEKKIYSDRKNYSLLNIGFKFFLFFFFLQVDPRRLIVANPTGAELEQFEENNSNTYYTYHKAVALGEIVAR